VRTHAEIRSFCTCMTIDEPPPNGPDARRQQRSSMFVSAVLAAGSEQAAVKVRNMSANGAMIESPLIPPPGTDVLLIRGALAAQGTIMWSSNDRCGVQFASALSVKEWLAPPARTGQQRVDELVALAKAGMLPASGVATGDSDQSRRPRSQEQLVEDLGAVARLLQDLEDDLASSDETLARHGIKLQNLDIAMQMVRAIAQELRSADKGPPASLARLEDLRVACAQALGTR